MNKAEGGLDPVATAAPPIRLAAARERIAVALLGRQTSVERIEPGASAGRVLAQALMAGFAQPGLPSSAMDGYALRAADAMDGINRLSLQGRSLAGAGMPAALPKGAAMRITTGAALPAGADTVVIQEHCRIEDGQLLFEGPLAVATNVRQPGEDFVAGTTLLPAGTRVGPVERALLAALGCTEVRLRARPRVAILSTGDELVAAGQPLRPGQIHDSNGPMLAALVLRCGGQPLPVQRVGDDPQTLLEALRRQAAGADLVLTAGGASVGDADLLPPLLQAHGVVHFHRLQLKPGMPCLFGELDGCPVLSLPGNPVSAFISFLLLGRFALRLLLDLDPSDPPALPVHVATPLHKRHGRLELQRCTLESREGRLLATPLQAQGSHLLTGLRAADGLLELPEGPLNWPAGQLARGWRLHDWWQ